MRKTKYPSVKSIVYTIENFAEGIDATTDENNTEFDKSVNSYNFEYKNGALTESIGFEALTLPTTTEEGCAEITARFYNSDSDGTFAKVAHFKEYSERYSSRKDKIFYISGDGKIYYSFAITQVPIFTRLEDKVYTQTPKMANYTDGERDCILFFNDADGIDSWNNNVNMIHYSNLDNFYDFSIYKDRVFAVPSGERLTIRSETTNLLTWTGSITSTSVLINLDRERGYINKLLSFNDYLFAIRDFGISRLYWGNKNSYNITHLLFSGSRIYSNTACVCGDRGIVLCKDGLYEFDNVSAQKLDLKLNRMLSGMSNQNAVAAFKDGVYYLACRLNFDDNEEVGCETGTYKNNALVMFDTQTNKYSICRGIDIIDLCAIQYLSCDKLLACFNGDYATSIGQLTTGGKMFGTTQSKFWRSPLTDMGYSDKIKYVKEVSLFSKYDITLTVFSENEKRNFNISGGNIISRIPVRVKGKQIGIEIRSSADKAYVSNLKLSCDLIENEYV